MTKKPKSDCSQPNELKMEIREERSLVVIGLPRESTFEKTKQMEDRLARLLQDDILYYVLDLSEVRMINSQQIGCLVRHIQQLSQKGKGGFTFVNPPDRVRYLLEITCAANLAPIFDTVEAAIESFPLPA